MEIGEYILIIDMKKKKVPKRRRNVLFYRMQLGGTKQIHTYENRRTIGKKNKSGD